MSEQNGRERPEVTFREIKTLQWTEAVSLARIRGQLDPDRPVPAARPLNDLVWLIERGGRAWIVSRASKIAGYGSVTPASGLPGLYELDGFIAAAYRRQGLASRLLAAMVEALAGGPMRQLYCPVTSLTSPAARFLLANDFFLEHEELFLALDDLAALPAATFAPGYAVRTFGRSKAIALFRELYRASFGGRPWYQPYEDEGEVAADLADESDLLFLMDRDRPIGFLWLRWTTLQTAEIEPIGLLSAYQGRGLGRPLMLAGLSHAARQGATRATIGAWRQNQAALALYERLGFQETHRKHYLAYDLRKG